MIDQYTESHLHQLLTEHAVLVQRGGLHDEYVALGVLRDVAGNRSEALPLARAQPAVADHDEVRRVGADGVEQATADMRIGRLTALIDPERTSREKLEALLKQREVTLKATAKE